MKMEPIAQDTIAPPRLQAALSENAKAWEKYNAMTVAQRREFIRRTRGARTEDELRAVVDGFVGYTQPHPPVQL